MVANSGFHEKMDALDLIINALKDHEKRLDDISQRLESLFDEIRTREVGKTEVVKERKRRTEFQVEGKAPSVVFSKWREFKDRCKGARIVTFEVEGNFFHVHSMVNGEVFKYSEELPSRRLKVVEEESGFSIDKASLKNVDLLQFLIEGRLKCGLNLTTKISRIASAENQFLFELSYDFNPDRIKEFLSLELDVQKSDVIEGKIVG